MVTALHHRPLSASGAARDATAQQATPPALEAFPMKLRGDIVATMGIEWELVVGGDATALDLARRCR
jgi:hypothetical protein